jgi:hypothetical protein
MIDIRYLAGLFDGEGCISLVKQKRANSSLMTYSIRVVIAMTHKPTIKAIHNQFGGNYSERKGNGINRNSFSVMWANRKAAPILAALLPYLQIKREEALIAIDFLAKLSSVGTSFWRKASQADIDLLFAEREAIRNKLAALKRVNHSVRWDDGEFGENPMPGVSAEGQSRAKQTTLKVVGRV